MSAVEVPEINIQDVIEKISEIANQIPEMVKNTVTVGLLSSKIPDEGVDIVDVARMGIDMYASRQDELPQGMGKAVAMVNNMSDEELVKTIQKGLESRGLDDLASNLDDGNLSRDDFINGVSEFGHTISEGNVISPDIREQVQNAMGDYDDPALIEGLVFAETFLDDVMVQAAKTMSELSQEDLTGVFDNQAFTTGESIDNGTATPTPLQPDENMEFEGRGVTLSSPGDQ